jgi:hypothetical protein
MPRYLLERTVGDVSREELDAIAARSTEIRLERYPGLIWEHTHVVRTPDGLKAFCLYAAPEPELVLAHAAELGLPVERFFEVETDLDPGPATPAAVPGH